MMLRENKPESSRHSDGPGSGTTGPPSMPRSRSTSRFAALACLDARIRIERLLDGPDERHGQIRAMLRHIPAQTSRMRALDVFGRRPLDRITPADQIKKQYTRAVDVGRDRSGSPQQRLGRHVNRRACGRPTVDGRVAAQHLAGTEVHQHNPAALGSHHVSGFDIAVNEVGAVHRRQRAAHVLPHHRRFLCAERALILDDVVERLALDQLHAEADLSLVDLHAQHRDDIRMADLRDGAPFLKHARLQRVLDALARVQQLDRDVSFELGVPGTVDCSKGPAAQLLHQIVTSPRARRRVGRHRTDAGFPRPVGRLGRPGRLEQTIRTRHLGHDAQLMEQLARVFVGRLRIEGAPVDGCAVGHRVAHVVEGPLLSRHVASRSQAAGSRGSRPRARRWRSACRARWPGPRTGTAVPDGR